MKAAPSFSGMLRDDLHDHARRLMADHLGHLLHGAGWSPDDVRHAAPAIAEILDEELPTAYRLAIRVTADTFAADLGHLVPAVWATPYLALAEHVARTLCGEK